VSTKGVADIVFCIDSSGSMSRCFVEVKRHVQDFVDGLRSGGNVRWDLRLDFLSYTVDSGGYQFYSLCYRSTKMFLQALYGQGGSPSFFTSDIGEFQKGVGRLSTGSDEASVIALDTALDYPWRDASSCHRVVVLLTDEAVETGSDPELERSKVDEIIKKLAALHVLLYLVTPESKTFEELSQADRCEHIVVDRGDGLASVDFQEVMSFIGKSVSVSNLQGAAQSAPRALFGQDRW
jgi:hypothetical protein